MQLVPGEGLGLPAQELMCGLGSRRCHLPDGQLSKVTAGWTSAGLGASWDCLRVQVRCAGHEALQAECTGQTAKKRLSLHGASEVFILVPGT